MQTNQYVKEGIYRRPGAPSPFGIRVGFPEEVAFRACRTLERVRAARIDKNATMMEL